MTMGEEQAWLLQRLKLRRDRLLQDLAEVNAEMDAITDAPVSEADADAWRGSGQTELVLYLRELFLQAGNPSVRTVAAATGTVSYSTVSLMLRGTRVPSWKTLQPVGKYLGADEKALKKIWTRAQIRKARRPQ